MINSVIETNSLWLKFGGELATYECPHCGQPTKTRLPKKYHLNNKGFWEKLTLCTVCGEEVTVRTWMNGEAKATKFE